MSEEEYSEDEDYVSSDGEGARGRDRRFDATRDAMNAAACGLGFSARVVDRRALDARGD